MGDEARPDVFIVPNRELVWRDGDIIRAVNLISLDSDMIDRLTIRRILADAENLVERLYAALIN